MVTTNTLIGSLLKIFNDSSKLSDPRPSSLRTGSLFWGPNQEVVFRNNSPRGKLRGGPTSISDKSYGRGAKRNKVHNVHVVFMTPQKYKSATNNLQDVELVQDYFEDIEQAVLDYGSMLGPVTLLSADMEDDGPFFVEDHMVHGASYLFTFMERK